jgi:hypothetical protein
MRDRTSLRLRVTLVGAAALLVVAAGCQVSDRSGFEVVGWVSEPVARVVVDPCRLLSAAEVEAALGSPVADGEPRSPIVPEPGLAMCGYGTVTQFGEIVVATQRPGRDAFASSRARAKQSGSTMKPAYRRLNGLGDRAFSAGSGVSVLKGNTLVQVFAQYSLPDFNPIARRLAAQAVRKVR